MRKRPSSYNNVKMECTVCHHESTMILERIPPALLSWACPGCKNEVVVPMTAELLGSCAGSKMDLIISKVAAEASW